MTQLKTFHFPATGLKQSLLINALGETQAQKSDSPKAPQKVRPERLGLEFLIPQTLKRQHVKPPNSV